MKQPQHIHSFLYLHADIELDRKQLILLEPMFNIVRVYLEMYHNQ
jgi:hypothetical protein